MDCSNLNSYYICLHVTETVSTNCSVYHICPRTGVGKPDCMKKPLACSPESQTEINSISHVNQFNPITPLAQLFVEQTYNF